MRVVCPLACSLFTLLAVLPATTAADQASDRVELARRLRSADRAVVATVQSVEPRLVRNRHGDVLIVSKLWLGVSEVVRGSSISSVSVDVEGGTLGGMTMRVSDLPEMKPGARALFLLGQLPDGSARLVNRGESILGIGPDDRLPGTDLSLRDVREVAQEVRR
jgi:hypothetical protein